MIRLAKTNGSVFFVDTVYSGKSTEAYIEICEQRPVNVRCYPKLNPTTGGYTCCHDRGNGTCRDVRLWPIADIS
jgi:hypothetical protein